MARKKAKDPREKRELKKRRTGMILSFFMICLLILLSSSFVLRYIYRGAANVSITPEGISEVYQTATGQTNFNVIEPDEEYEFTYDDTYVVEDEDNSTQNNSNNYNSSNSRGSDSSSNQNNSQGYTDGTGVYNNSSNNSGNNSSNNSNNSGNSNSNNNSITEPNRSNPNSSN